MKKRIAFILIIIGALNVFSQIKNPSILGQWKEIEYYGNDGSHDYVQKVVDGRTFVFEENNVFKDGLGNKGTYHVSGDSLHVLLPESEFYFRFYENKKGEIALGPVTENYEIICDEGCAFIFKKVLPAQKIISEKTDIISISYQQVGGEMGGYTNIKLTQDSITGIFIGNGNHKTIIREKTAADFWDSLTQSANIKDFQVIKSGKSVVHLDGSDIALIIESKNETYTLLNGDIDSIKNKNVYELIRLFEKKLRKLYLRENPE
jgi:hypothetical protein